MIHVRPIPYPFAKFCLISWLAHHFHRPIDSRDDIAQVSIFLVVVNVVLLGASRRIGDFLLGLVSLIVNLVFKSVGSQAEVLRHRTSAQIPKSMKTALSYFNFQPNTTVYAVCTACNCTYKPVEETAEALKYPARCTNRPCLEDEPCGTVLVRDPDDGCQVPIKTFVYHHFHDYLAGLLARKELETLMDKSCDDLQQNLSQSPTFLKDVWDAEFLRTFKGPCGQKNFTDRQGEGRSMFSLHVDFFNMQGNLQRNATTSCGIISCACLNLPLDIRYKPENMYLAGIIPGPRKPSMEQLNNFLNPLIDDMVVSWERGVQFSRTASHRDRVTRSAIACVVCDLPAARKTAQLAGATSHFYCSACHCFHLSTLGRTDMDSETWSFRDKAELRGYAEQWRDAHSSTQRNKLFVKYGVRWSSLWRLPYWDPARQLVVDSMHCLLLGLAHAHFREYLGLTSNIATMARKSCPAFEQNFRPINELPETLTPQDLRSVEKIQTLLLSGVDDLSAVDRHLEDLEKKLTARHAAALKVVVGDLELEVEGRRTTKVQLAKALVAWVSDQIFSVRLSDYFPA